MTLQIELPFLIAFAAVVGGVLGSLLNVVATRLPADGDPPVVGLPLRPSTGQPDPLGLVPFAGAWMRGLHSIDWPKLGTELAALALIALSFGLHGATLRGITAAVFTLLLLLVLRIDWQNHLIFSATILPGIAVALALRTADSVDALVAGLLASVLAALAFFLLFALAIVIYKQRALGFGDVLLAALIGAMTGSDAAGALVLGIILAGLGSGFLLVTRIRTSNDFIPYGAYMCLGAIVAILV